MVLTREILGDYQKKELEIQRLEEKIEYFASYIPPSEHGVVTGSMREFPYKQCHFVISGSNIKDNQKRQDKLKSLVIMLQERRQKFLDMEIEVGRAIEEIESEEMRQIIEDKYIKGLTDGEIAEKMGFDRSTITKRLNNFFEKK